MYEVHLYSSTNRQCKHNIYCVSEIFESKIQTRYCIWVNEDEYNILFINKCLYKINNISNCYRFVIAAWLNLRKIFFEKYTHYIYTQILGFILVLYDGCLYKWFFVLNSP